VSLASIASGIALLIIICIQASPGDGTLPVEDLILSLYCVLMGLLVIWFELSWIVRLQSTLPFRAICYVLIGLPAMFSTLLRTTAIGFFLTAVVNFVSGWIGEVFIREPKEKSGKPHAPTKVLPSQ
jgi:hypothetical protein